jgi:hypothetical protein
VGILSDFIVADPSQAGSIGASVDRGPWPALQSKGFTVLEVGLLHFALTGEDAAAHVNPRRFVRNPFTKKDQPVTVLGAYVDAFRRLEEGEGWWVHELPASLVAEVANANDLGAVAEKWAAFEELRGADRDHLAELLVELQRLARLARAQRESLLLWTSL